MSEALPNLTALEIDLLGGCYRSEYTDGVSLPMVWTWSIRTKICTDAQKSGVISSLVKKGVVTVGGSGTKDDDLTVDVTPLGGRVADALGLGWNQSEPTAEEEAKQIDAITEHFVSRMETPEPKKVRAPIVREGRTLSILESCYHGANIESISFDLDTPAGELGWYMKDLKKRGLITNEAGFYRLTDRGLAGMNACHKRMGREER